MTRRLAVLVLALSLLGLAAPTTGAQAPAARAAQGSRHAMPSAYSWLDRETPAKAYSITLIRGLTPAQALRKTGVVKRRLGRLNPAEAAHYWYQHSDVAAGRFPTVVQVRRLGNAVMIYEPYGFRPYFRLGRLSTGGTAAVFKVSFQGGTRVKVARGGKVIRSFSARNRPPRRGALPEERGLDFGARGQNAYATGWAFNERLTLAHISLAWFAGSHPTYVLKGGGY